MKTSIVRDEIFSFHLVQLALLPAIGYILLPLHKRKIIGLKHSEAFFIMNLGESVLGTRRYKPGALAFYFWWQDASYLDEFLEQSKYCFFKEKGWYLCLKKYRQWGTVRAIDEAITHSDLETPAGTMAAITLARLKLSQTLRFIKWGKPVEKQVRDHPGKSLALAAMRPPNTFCTFSLWHSEAAMLEMVRGEPGQEQNQEHKLAMLERKRKPFHYEFATMRCAIIQETGEWQGESNYSGKKKFESESMPANRHEL